MSERAIPLSRVLASDLPDRIQRVLRTFEVPTRPRLAARCHVCNEKLHCDTGLSENRMVRFALIAGLSTRRLPHGHIGSTPQRQIGVVYFAACGKVGVVGNAGAPVGEGSSHDWGG